MGERIEIYNQMLVISLKLASLKNTDYQHDLYQTYVTADAVWKMKKAV